MLLPEEVEGLYFMLGNMQPDSLCTRETEEGEGEEEDCHKEKAAAKEYLTVHTVRWGHGLLKSIYWTCVFGVIFVLVKNSLYSSRHVESD